MLSVGEKMSIKITRPFFATVACKAHKEIIDSGRVLWNLTVPVCELPEGLPLDPNARLANEKRRTVKGMLKTLAEKPQEFIYYNNGILIIADSIEVKGHGTGGGFDIVLLLETPDGNEEEKFIGNGIVNGGHTYTAIMKARDRYKNLKSNNFKAKVNTDTGKIDYFDFEQALVQISILINVSQEQISDISRYRNTSESVEEFSLKNLAGEWDIIQQHLSPEYKQYVAFRDGEDKKFDVTDLVRRLACINNKLYPWRGEDGTASKNPTSAFTSYGRLIKNWKKEDFTQVVPLLDGLLEIEELLRKEYDDTKGISKYNGIEKKNYKFITGKEFTHTLALPFIFPILAAFRVFVKDGKWEQPPQELWNKMGSTLVINLLAAYKNEGRGNPAFFGRSTSTWSNLLLTPMQLKIRLTE